MSISIENCALLTIETVKVTDESGGSNATSAAVTFTATVQNSRPVLDAIADRMVSNAATSTSTIGVLVTDADGRDTHALTATSTDPAVAGVGDREGRPAGCIGGGLHRTHAIGVLQVMSRRPRTPRRFRHTWTE